MATVIVTIGERELRLDDVVYAAYTASTDDHAAHVHVYLTDRVEDVYGGEAEAVWQYLRTISHDATGRHDVRNN